MAERSIAVVDSNEPVELRTLEQQNAENAGLAKLIMTGDLKSLTPDQKVQVYIARCNSLGLDVRAQPFEVINFKGVEKLYPKKEAAEQLRRIHGISTKVVDETTTPEGILRVTIKAWDRHGREDEEIAAVFVKGLQGPDLANAMMKVISKAKRRVTLSMCGLGAMAEVEEDDPEIFRRSAIDPETGEITTITERTVETTPDPDAARKAALARLHAAGKEAGMNHEQVKEFALVHFPSIESLTSLSPAELNILADTVKEAAKHGLTSQEAVEKADTVRDIGAEIEAEYLAAIEKAETIDDLVEIGLALRENSVSTEALREAYQARREAL